MSGVNVAMIPLNAAQMNDFGNGNLVLGPPTQQNPGESGQGFADMSSGSGAGEFSVFNPFMDYSAAAAAAANMQVSVSGPGGGSVYDQQQQHQPQQQQHQQMNPAPFQMNPAGGKFMSYCIFSINSIYSIIFFSRLLLYGPRPVLTASRCRRAATTASAGRRNVLTSSCRSGHEFHGSFGHGNAGQCTARRASDASGQYAVTTGFPLHAEPGCGLAAAANARHARR